MNYNGTHTKKCIGDELLEGNMTKRTQIKLHIPAGMLPEVKELEKNKYSDSSLEEVCRILIRLGLDTYKEATKR